MKIWVEPFSLMYVRQNGKFEHFHITVLEFGYGCLFEITIDRWRYRLRFLWFQKNKMKNTYLKKREEWK